MLLRLTTSHSFLFSYSYYTRFFSFIGTFLRNHENFTIFRKNGTRVLKIKEAQIPVDPSIAIKIC